MQHYTRNTVEVSEWCNVCRRETRHRVDGVRYGQDLLQRGARIGPCLEHVASHLSRDQERRAAADELKRANLPLDFGGNK